MKKPTRRDLLIVIGRLQRLIGLAGSKNHDRNPNRFAEVTAALDAAHNLCVDARSFDAPIENSRSPWFKTDSDVLENAI
jgi:hypothetical protein